PALVLTRRQHARTCRRPVARRLAVERLALVDEPRRIPSRSGDPARRLLETVLDHLRRAIPVVAYVNAPRSMRVGARGPDRELVAMQHDRRPRLVAAL